MTELDAAQRAKILTPPVLRLLAALETNGNTAAVIGGAVRDVVSGRTPGDIDLATSLPPERVMETLAAHGIKTVPTGLAHGTVTAVIDHIGYEITTLRRDVATDGRHAEVAFTNDWREDAARRDFTFNALSVDARGTLTDYFDGAADARAGRVRFIGDAATRIDEDVLRILRFFRFTATVGQGAPDPQALEACRAKAALIPRLSAERIAHELFKLLAAADPLPALRLMDSCGVLAACADEARDFPRLSQLLATEKSLKEPPTALLRLSALLPQNAQQATAFAARLKLAKRDSDRLATQAELPALLRTAADTKTMRRLLYRFGVEALRAAILLEGEHIPARLACGAAWENPSFPVRGNDIVQAGIPAGPRVGDILRATENWWIDQDFRPDRAACLTHLNTLIEKAP